MRRAGQLALWLCTSCAWLSCADTPRTEIVVVVDSDMRVPMEIDGVEIDVVGPDGETSSTMGDLASEPLPRSVGVVHDAGPLAPVTVRVRATLAGTTVVEREMRTAFVRSETVVLLVPLLRSCVGVSCRNGESCGERGCETNVVDATRLPRWSGSEPRIDGAVPAPPPPPRDGSTDAPGDSGALDAGRSDAGTADTGVVDAAGTDAAAPDMGAPMCPAERGDCNDDPSDGCETSLRTDDNCNACGVTCRGGGRHCCPDGTCERGC